MEEIETSTCTDSGNFHVFLVFPWKLSQTVMEVNILPPTSLEESGTFHGNVHGR